MKKNNDIDKIREAIDDVDYKILSLLSERGSLAKEIGEIKKHEGGSVYVPSREREIFQRLSQDNPGPYNNLSLYAIFREIISATRALEEPLRVAFLGPEATFTHMAAVEQFGGSATYVPQLDISSVFKEVEKGHAQFGVVPIENSTEGIVNRTLDIFVESDLKICSEIVVSVEHHLLSAETNLKSIQKVYSHPHALAQCRQWLGLHMPNVELHQVESTASGASRVTEEKGSAAVASAFAADFYNLNILVRNIQDLSNNFTRFLVLGNAQMAPTKNDKTSIAFVTKDKPGILYQLLKPLSEANINLTKIESRPLRSKVWEYMFFIDLDGHSQDKKIQKTLKQLEKQCLRFKILGSYPKHVRITNE